MNRISSLDTLWLDTCARRPTELEDGMSVAAANRIAARIWSDEPPVCFRQGHPVAAAEMWHAGGGSQLR